MAALQNKIDFVAVVSVTMANSNGDPLDGNRPRTTYDNFGEISDVCIKRKLRNRMQDMGNCIFVQSQDRCDDGASSLSDRANKAKELPSGKELEGYLGREKYARAACEKWLDVRTFGQVFAFKDKKKRGEDGSEGSVSVGVRGPVSIHQAMSASPVEIVSMQITKSVSGEDSATRGSDTMGMKHAVRFGLYTIKGSINVQLAEKTGFSEEDAETLKECLRTLFINDASSARPDGSMEVLKLYWFRHSCRDGQYSTAKVHRSVQIAPREDVSQPRSVDDYVLTLNQLPGLSCEVLEGV